MGSPVLIRFAPPVAFVLLVHTAVLLDLPELGVFALVAVSILNLIVNRLTGGSRRGLIFWSVLGGLAAVALVAAIGGAEDLVQVVLLPPVLLNGLFLYIFGRTILPGREPLITRFRRLDLNDLTPEIRRYTRRLTVCWVVFFAASLAASILLALYADPATWSWFVNVACPLAAIVFFLSEHLYRARRRDHLGPVSLTGTFRAMFRPGAWNAGTWRSSADT
jgi:uncharacterized membrane protein